MHLVEILRNNTWYSFTTNSPGSIDLLMDICREAGIVAERIRIDGSPIPNVPK